MTSESILGTGKDSPRETREGSSRSNAVVAKSKDREFEEEGHTESVEFQILDNGDKRMLWWGNGLCDIQGDIGYFVYQFTKTTKSVCWSDTAVVPAIEKMRGGP